MSILYNKVNPSVLVIGGTRGIGKEIVDYFNGDSVSRANGYNIDERTSRSGIADKSLEYDIVVNNAYSGSLGQTEMLLKLFEAWKDANHVGYLFNSGSDASTVWRMKPGRDTMYSALKGTQNTLSHYIARSIQEGKVPFRFTNIIFGMLNTEKSRSKPHYNNGVDGESVCNIIECLYSMHKDCLIPEFIMEARWINNDN